MPWIPYCGIPIRRRPVSKHSKNVSKDLGDFTATTRVIPISLLAIGIGILSSFVARALLRLIGFFTNAFYYGRISPVLVWPAGNQPGLFPLVVAVVDRGIVGFVA